MRPNQILSMRDILYIFFKRKLAFAVIVAISLIGSLGYVALAIPEYRCSIRFLVKLGHEKTSALSNVAEAHPNFLFQERSQSINDELEILKTLRVSDEVFNRIETAHEELLARPRSGIKAVRWFVADVLETVTDVILIPAYLIGLMDRKTDQQRFVDRLASSLEFQAIEDTNMIEVSFWWWDPGFASLVLDEVSRAYIPHHIRVHETEGIENFYSDQINLLSKSLAEHERDIDEFVNDAGISAIEHQKDLLLDEISGLEVKRTQLALGVEQARVKTREVRSMRSTPGAWIETPDLGESMSQFDALDQLYFSIQRQRTEKLGTYIPNSREIRRLDEQLEALRSQKADSVLTSIRLLESVIAGDLKAVGGEIDSRHERLAKLTAATIPLEALQRERKVVESNYLLYKREAEERRISASLNSREITSVVLVNPPRPPESASWPRKYLILGISAGVGLLLAIGFCFIAEFMNHTFRDPEDVAGVLGLRVLTAVPDLSDLEPVDRREARRA